MLTHQIEILVKTLKLNVNKRKSDWTVDPSHLPPKPVVTTTNTGATTRYLTEFRVPACNWETNYIHKVCGSIMLATHHTVWRSIPATEDLEEKTNKGHSTTKPTIFIIVYCWVGSTASFPKEAFPILPLFIFIPNQTYQRLQLKSYIRLICVTKKRKENELFICYP